MNRSDNSVIIECELETKSFDKQIEKVEGRLQEIDDLLKKADLGYDVGDVKKLELEYEKLNNQLFGLIKKRDALTKKSYFETFNQGLANVTKKVAKWGLALFSIRSAYSMIRRSVSMLTEENEQLATDVKFIQYALAQVLKPIVEFIIKMIYKLLGLINAIYIKIFGTSLFTKEMADGFKKSNQAANKLKKTLAGFDEMNVLNDDGSVGVAGSIVAPNLGKATKEMDSWINETSNKFYKLGNDIPFFLSNPKSFTKAYGVWDKFMEGLTRLIYGLYQPFKGLIDAVSGVAVSIYGIFTGDFDLIKAGAKQFVQALGETFGGLINIVKGIGEMIIGIIKVAYSAIFNGLAKGAKDAWNGVKNVFSPAASWFDKNFITPIKNIFNKLPSWVNSLVKRIVNGVIDTINFMISGINKMLIPLRAAIAVMGLIMGKGWTLEAVSIPKIPRLAKGGIINMPGKGVPIGGAIGGEKQQEGVIPLTDSQQMALLGEAIGKYININATIPVYVGNRQIAREIQKIQNLNDFATNR